MRHTRDIFFKLADVTYILSIYLSKRIIERAKVSFRNSISPHILLIIWIHRSLYYSSTFSKFIFIYLWNSYSIYFFTSSLLIIYFLSLKVLIWGVGIVSIISSDLHFWAKAEFSNLTARDFFNIFFLLKLPSFL